MVCVAPAHQVSKGPGGSGSFSHCNTAKRYYASLVAEALMRAMLVLRPARSPVSMLGKTLGINAHR